MRKIIVAFISFIIVFTLACLIYLGFIGFQIVASRGETPAISEEADFFNLELGELINGEIFRTLGKNFELRYPKDWSLTKLALTSDSFIDRWRLTKNPKKPDSLKIDIEVIAGTVEKPVVTEEVEINNVEYLKTVVKQKEEISKIIVSTAFGNKTFRITAHQIKTPQDIQEVEAIFSTFRLLR